jgi:PTH1 family peptidyl-tRNA hydrolase
MRLLVGLGNPGGQYARNRHNIGYRAADEIVRRYGFSPWRAKFQGVLAEGAIGDVRLLALKPETYMNLSGEAAAAAARFYKIEPADIVVFHDDLDLAPGRVRVKRGGGTGGHNGLKSIDACLGVDYWRVRIGIGHPGDRELVTPWVLGDFAKDDARWVNPLLDAVAEHVPLLVAGDADGFLSKMPKDLPGPEGES